MQKYIGVGLGQKLLAGSLAALSVLWLAGSPGFAATDLTVAEPAYFNKDAILRTLTPRELLFAASGPFGYTDPNRRTSDLTAEYECTSAVQAYFAIREGTSYGHECASHSRPMSVLHTVAHDAVAAEPAPQAQRSDTDRSLPRQPQGLRNIVSTVNSYDLLVRSNKSR
jgi:hypothetical protein